MWSYYGHITLFRSITIFCGTILCGIFLIFMLIVGISRIILSVPRNILIDLNHVMLGSCLIQLAIVDRANCCFNFHDWNNDHYKHMSHGRIVVRCWKLCKFIIVIDFHVSFTCTWRLFMTCMLVVDAKITGARRRDFSFSF